nr:negative elongation factor B [Hymenolepis microstoma]
MSKAIKKLLEKGPAKVEEIEKFQEELWEQMVESFSPSLKILDIHDISRHSVLWNINDRLLEVVKSRIQEIPAGSDKYKGLLKKLLTNASSFIHHQYLRPTIMMVLSKVPNIREKYINMIVNHEALYNDTPLPVLRQIWMNKNNTKFKEEVMKLIQNYQNAYSDGLLESVLSSVTCSCVDTLPMLFWAPRRRRKDPSLLKLIEMIGDNTALYEKTLQIFREEYAKYQHSIEQTATRRATLSSSEMPSKPFGKKKEEPVPPVHFTFIPPALLPSVQSVSSSVLCALRFDLLMGLNDAKLESIFQSDKIHRFVWGMDACIKNKEIDRRHAKDLVATVGGQQYRYTSGRHVSVSALVGEMGLDQDTSDDWVPDAEEKPSTSNSRKKASRSAPKVGEKRSIVDADSDTEATEKGNRRIRIDLQMVCRDPWVVYTICSTLLKIVIKNGLSEDKLPRNLSDVPFLVNLLMRGLENDLTPPEIFASKDTSIKGEPKNKRARKQQQIETTQLQPPKLDSSTALITQVLPAAAELHLTTWKNQLSEKVRTLANQIWFKTGSAEIPGQWQKRLDACQNIPLTISPSYLAHPVGHLFLQYHALFALERREWSVLRALLKAAASAAKPSKAPPKLQAGTNAATKTQIQSTVVTTIGFRWRPECLQAIALGIASSPDRLDEVQKSGSRRNDDVMSGALDKPGGVKGTASELPSVSTESLAAEPPTNSPVTRAELASLLRTSLPLHSDLQLIVLALCAKLVPATPSTPTTPGSAGAATPMPNFFVSTGGDLPFTVPRSVGSSERERMMNALSRHIEFTATGEGEENPVTSPSGTTGTNASGAGASFKSTNPKVLEAFEWLKKDFERATSSGIIPIMGTSKPACGKAMTPLSPLGGSMPSSQYGLASPSRLMPPPSRFAPRTARYAPNAFPMATPLTNPGLSMPQPSASSAGSHLPLSPLAEYRPSPLGGGPYPSYATPMSSTTDDGGDLRRYTAVAPDPIGNRSPSPPLPPPATQYHSPPSP